MSKSYPADNSKDSAMSTIAQHLPEEHELLDVAYNSLLIFNNAIIEGEI